MPTRVHDLDKYDAYTTRSSNRWISLIVSFANNQSHSKPFLSRLAPQSLLPFIMSQCNAELFLRLTLTSYSTCAQTTHLYPTLRILHKIRVESQTAALSAQGVWTQLFAAAACSTVLVVASQRYGHASLVLAMAVVTAVEVAVVAWVTVVVIAVVTVVATVEELNDGKHSPLFLQMWVGRSTQYGGLRSKTPGSVSVF